MTFEWEDITDEVLEKVVYVKYTPNPTSGFADYAGSLTAITENGQEYKIGFEEASRNREVEILKLFLGELPQTHLDCANPSHEMRKWRYRRTYFFGNIFIRKDLFDRVISEWEKQLEHNIVTVTEVAKNLLDPQGKLPRMVLSETQAIWDEEERERREREEWKAKNRLVEGEDYEWKEFRCTSLEHGYYLLLFKRNEDGSISGSRWTIVCQREQFEEGSFKSDAPVEAYNLYYKRYENMGGILQYPEDGNREDKEIYRYTTLTDDPKNHEHGRFHRTYFTLEQAKSAALTRNEFMGWGNYYKANLLTRNWSEMSLEEAKKDYFRAVKRELELRLLFPKICGEVLRILSKCNTSGDAVKKIGESLGLSKDDVRLIIDFFSDYAVFCKTELEETEKLLAEAGGVQHKK